MKGFLISLGYTLAKTAIQELLQKTLREVEEAPADTKEAEEVIKKALETAKSGKALYKAIRESKGDRR
jgi:hypothetical protein